MRRRGLTLVEILVVIAIIAVLTGLLLPAVQRVRNSARRAQVQTEIGQIANAVTAFKAATRVSYIPCTGGGPNGEFRLRGTYYGSPSGAQVGTDSPECVYLMQVFPFLGHNPATRDRITGLPDLDLDANQTLVFFLTGGEVTDYQGFSRNKQQPFAPATSGTGEQRLGPFLEVNRTRLVDPDTRLVDGRYRDPYGTPYAYFSWHQSENRYPPGASFAWGESRCFTYMEDGVTPRVIHPKGFQIISAGADQRFGAYPYDANDTAPGLWKPGQGDWKAGGTVFRLMPDGYRKEIPAPGADDVSNFNAGPLVTRAD